MFGRRCCTVSETVVKRVVALPKDGARCLSQTVAATEEGLESNSIPAGSTPKLRNDELKPFKSIPGPKGYPLIGTLPEYLRKDGLKFNKLFEVMQLRAKQYGPIYKERIGHMEQVVISDPKEYLKVVQVDGKFPNRLELEPMAEHRRRRGLDQGIVNTQGQDWYKNRALLIQKVLKVNVILGYTEHMDEVADDFVKQLESLSGGDGVVEDLEMKIFNWALESIGTILFDERVGCFKSPPPQIAQDFIINLVGFFRNLQLLMYSPPLYKVYSTKDWKKFEANSDEVVRIGRHFVSKKLEELKNNPNTSIEDSESFLTSLLKVANFDVELVTTNVVDLMTGGVETTSTSLLWVLHCLATNPEAQAAIHKEVKEKMAGKDHISPEDLQQIPYTKACLKEMFRLYPLTFTTSRRISQDIEVCGYRVPKGSHCQANLYGMGRDETIFENAEKFQPDRWLDKDSPIFRFPNLFFGHGSRMCIGRRIAEQELFIAMIKILQNFEIFSRNDEVNPVLTLVMTADRPIKIHFKKRQAEN